jgi:eukaryotic-like serine/threonine-protein kinase
MSPERWSEVMELFQAAHERAVAERPAFLAAACGDDAELQKEVAALLAADEDASPFLALEEGAELRAAAIASRAGERHLIERLQEALGAAYRVERELGGGGMSRVFVAEETRLGRRVAVKVLPPELEAALVAERFHREARLIASLRHPHIVPLLAAGEGPGGLLYYTMPYLEGESLERRLEREGRLSLAVVVAIVREVAGALAYAHERGVIHRDIKPANVLMEGAHALVADFGIAKAAMAGDRRDAEGRGEHAPGGAIAGDAPPSVSRVTLTAAGFVLGTPAYMSPEQAAGGHVDARSDVYSLGCLTFELLTGQRPFADLASASITRRAIDAPPSASALVPDLPPGIDAVLTRAFAPLPEGRFQGTTELADELSRAATPTATPTATAPVMPRWSRRRIATLSLAVIAIVAGAAEVTRRIATSEPTQPSAAARRTLAVLPFENVGPPGDAYFADGVTDELTSRLTNLPDLRVISPRSTREYRGTTKPPVQIGRELGADYLLQGRVRWEKPNDKAGQVRVTAELLSGSDGSAVWADRYDAVAGDVMDVESRIAERVATSLHLVLGDSARQTLAARPTADFEAYSDFLRGEALRLAPGDASAGLQAAIQYERAIARDPRFALAYARLSETHSRIYHFNVDRSEQRIERARVAAETAVRLAPGLAEAHLALGYYHYYTQHDFRRAQEELTRALAAQPGRADILLPRAYVLRRQGRFAEAAANLARAVELDPRSALAAWDLAETYAMMRAYREAMPYYDRAIALAPDFANAYAERARRLAAWTGDTASARQVVREGLRRANPGQVVARLNTGATLLLGDGPAERDAVRGLTADSFGQDTTQFYLWMADWSRLHGDSPRRRAYADSARRRIEALMIAAPNDSRYRLVLAAAYAQLGRAREALREAERGFAAGPIDSDAIDGPNWVQDLAYVETIAGAHDSAISRLEYLLRVPSDQSVPLLRLDPRWDPLRGNPRFQRLVATAR